MSLLLSIINANIISVNCTSENVILEITTLSSNLCFINQSIQIFSENDDLNIPKSDKSWDFQGFLIQNNEVYYFPKAVEISFKDLFNLIIRNSKLRKISPKNLSNFGFLKYLDLSYNEIERLEENIFANNRDLRIILLNNNRINFVHPTSFKSGHSYDHVNLLNNTCISNIGKISTVEKDIWNEMRKKCFREQPSTRENAKGEKMEKI